MSSVVLTHGLDSPKDATALTPVLLLAYYYPPRNTIGAARPSRFVRYLRGFGYDCEVVSSGEKTGFNTTTGVHQVAGRDGLRLALSNGTSRIIPRDNCIWNFEFQRDTMSAQKTPESRTVDEAISEMVAFYDESNKRDGDDLDAPESVPVKPKPHRNGGATVLPESDCCSDAHS